MPYIVQKDRECLKPEIDALVSKLQAYGFHGGQLNYTISKIIQDVWKAKPSYLNGAAICGLLICVLLEFYRRVLSPYEDKKIEENGDI